MEIKLKRMAGLVVVWWPMGDGGAWHEGEKGERKILGWRRARKENGGETCILCKKGKN